MYQPQELFANLSTEEISRTLHLSGLTEKDMYTEDDADRFRQCRSLIDQGITDEQIINQLPPAPPQPPVTPVVIEPTVSEVKQKKSKSKKLTPSNPETTSILELKAIASELLGAKLSLSQTLTLIAAVGLPEKDEYTTDECEAVETFIKNQGQPVDLKSSITTATIASESGLALLIDRITDNLAQKIPGLVNQMYVQKVSHQLANSTEQIQDFYVQLEQVILDEIEGKSPILALLERPWMTTPLPPSLLKSAQSPNESENDTNGD